MSNVLKQNLKLASNGKNKLRLEIPENEVQTKFKIKRESVLLLLKNIISLNLKNM